MTDTDTPMTDKENTGPTKGPVTLQGPGSNMAEQIDIHSVVDETGVVIAEVYWHWPAEDKNIWPERKRNNYADAHFIADAFNTYTETNLTPRQLLDEIERLQTERDNCIDVIERLEAKFSDRVKVLEEALRNTTEYLENVRQVEQEAGHSTPIADSIIQRIDAALSQEGEE